jgi:hypothetical protein
MIWRTHDGFHLSLLESTVSVRLGAFVGPRSVPAGLRYDIRYVRLPSRLLQLYPRCHAYGMFVVSQCTQDSERVRTILAFHDHSTKTQPTVARPLTNKETSKILFASLPHHQLTAFSIHRLASPRLLQISCVQVKFVGRIESLLVYSTTHHYLHSTVLYHKYRT